MGRRSKLTPELIAETSRLLSETGLFRRDVAAMIGVCEQTFSLWFTQGGGDDPEFEAQRHFRDAVLQAEANFKANVHAQIVSGTRESPKLGMTLLGRRWPDQYGRKDNYEDRSSDDKAAESAAVRELLLERLGKLLPEEPPSAG